MDGTVPGRVRLRRGPRVGLVAALLALGWLAAPGGASAELFVSSAGNDRVLRYGDDGAFLGAFASVGDGLGFPMGYGGGAAGRAGGPGARWQTQGSSVGFFEILLGSAEPGDVPVPADYDGDGRTDAAVYRRRTGEWLILGSAAGALTRSTGPPRRADLPLGRPAVSRRGGPP